MKNFNELYESIIKESNMDDFLIDLADDLFQSKNDNEMKKLLNKNKKKLGDMDFDKIITSTKNAADEEEVLNILMGESVLTEINWSNGEMNAMKRGISKRKDFCPKCGMMSYVYPGKYKKACSACGFVAEPLSNPIKTGTGKVADECEYDPDLSNQCKVNK